MAANFYESKTAPFANSGSVLMSFVELNILDWVAESEFKNACATGCIAVNFYDWKVVN